jgi:hypothetical protein
MFAIQYRIHFDAERALIGAGASTLMNGHHVGWLSGWRKE